MPNDRNKRFAFFDVDGTLISIKSMFSFQTFYYSKWLSEESSEFQPQRQEFEKTMTQMQAEEQPREAINAAYYRFFAGRSPRDTQECAFAWFKATLDKRWDLFLPRSVDVLKHHQSEGVEPTFVSGSSMEILAPLAESLGVPWVLATHLEVENGVYTGRICPPQTIGAGKADAIRLFLAEQNVDARLCFAYGDDRSDLSMLELVGHPCVVSGDPVLEELACARNWPIIMST
ncbi:HAD-IB family hydrolase [Azospirillaceae bacterium]